MDPGVALAARGVVAMRFFRRPPMMGDLLMREVRARKTGMAFHYPTLYGMLTGLHAAGSLNTLEFGAGKSTEIFLSVPNAIHTSIDPVRPTLTVPGGALWNHFAVTSREFPWFQYRAPLPVWGLVLHDGAHDAETVEHDLRRAIPKIYRYGLILVHDTLHSEVGHGVRKGMEAALVGVPHTALTLPYGFGLTIIRVETGHWAIRDARPKRGSDAHTAVGLA